MAETSQIRLDDYISQLIQPLFYPSFEPNINSINPTFPRGKIYSIPSSLRDGKERAYTPCLVSIGLIHHRAATEDMNKRKESYVSGLLYSTYMLDRVKITLCTKEMLKLARVANECYPAEFRLELEATAKIMLLDGCFILRVLMMWYDGARWKELNDIIHDLLLIENQIPFFILKALSTILGLHSGISLEQYIINFFCSQSNAHFKTSKVGWEEVRWDEMQWEEWWGRQWGNMRVSARPVDHILCLLHTWYRPTGHMIFTKINRSNHMEFMIRRYSATEIFTSGISLKPSRNEERYPDVSFKTPCLLRGITIIFLLPLWVAIAIFLLPWWVANAIFNTIFSSSTPDPDPMELPDSMPSTPTASIQSSVYMHSPLTNPIEPPLSMLSPPTASTQPPVYMHSPLTNPIEPPLSMLSPPTASTQPPVYMHSPLTNPIDSPFSMLSPPTASTQPPVYMHSPLTNPIEPPFSMLSSPTASMQSPVYMHSPLTNPIEPPLSMLSPPTTSTQPPVYMHSPLTNPIEPPLSMLSPPTASTQPPVYMHSPLTNPIEPPFSMLSSPTASTQSSVYMQPPVYMYPPPTNPIEPPLSMPSRTASCCWLSFLCQLFRRAALEIPELDITDSTESFLRNLIAYEQFTLDVPPYITSYAFLMDMIVNTKEHIEILEKSGVLKNYLVSSEAAADLFNSLCTDVALGDTFYFSQQWKQVDAYCNLKWPSLLGSLRVTYFSNPWTGISVFAALVLFAFTGLQTVGTVVQTWYKN